MITGIAFVSQGARCVNTRVDSVRATNVLVVQLLLARTAVIVVVIVSIGCCSCSGTVGLVVAGVSDDGSDVGSGQAGSVGYVCGRRLWRWS